MTTRTVNIDSRNYDAILIDNKRYVPWPDKQGGMIFAPAPEVIIPEVIINRFMRLLSENRIHPSYHAQRRFAISFIVTFSFECVDITPDDLADTARERLRF